MSTPGFPAWDHWYPCSGLWWCLPRVSQPGTTDTHVLDSGDVYPGFPSLGPLIPMFWTLVMSTPGFPAWDHWYPCSGLWWCLPRVSQPWTTDTHVLDSGEVYPGFPSLGPLVPMFWTLVKSTLGFPAWDHWYPCSGLWWSLPWVSQPGTTGTHVLDSGDVYPEFPSISLPCFIACTQWIPQILHWVQHLPNSRRPA